MKHEASTLNTKKALAASLKRFMAKKPLSRITVSEIVADCGFNRKTFYYHFDDVYALLRWTLEREAVDVIRSFDLLANPEESILFVMDYVDENKHILNCAYDCMGREGMKRFFHDDFIGVAGSVVTNVERQLGVSVGEDFKRFLIAYHTGAIVNMLIDYFHYRDKADKATVVRSLLLILQASIPDSLAAAAAAGM